MQQALFWVTAALLARYCFADVPVDKLKHDVNWLLPLRIASTYKPIKKGQILTLGNGVIDIDALVQHGINKDTLSVIYYDSKLMQWVKVPQVLVEYPNGGPDAANELWDYGPYVGNDMIYFEISKTIEPLTVSNRYVLVSAEQNAQKNWSIPEKQLPETMLFRMSDADVSASVGWCVEKTEAAFCNILPCTPKPYAPSPVSIRYQGKGPKSFARVLSRTIQLKPGEKVEWRVICQITKFPELTMDNLPGKTVIKRPGQTESRIPRIIWGLIFRDKSGHLLRKAPQYWNRQGNTHKHPVEITGSFTVPANASSYQYCFTLGGEGDIRFDVLDIILHQKPEPMATEYTINVARKVFFPQVEMRKSSDGAFQVNKGITVWLSPEVRKMTDNKKYILLDGLREYRLTSGTDSAKLRVSLLDENLELPSDINANRKVKELINKLPAEGYILSISTAKINIWARDSRGAFYALQELGERLRIGGAKTSAAFIIDWPELPLRMVHLHLTWRRLNKPKEYYTKWIPQLARNRINAIAFDLRRDWYELGSPKIRKRWEWVFNFCRKWNVTPIPMGYDFRNSMPVHEAIWLTPGKWIENEAYILRGQETVPLRPKSDAFRFRPLRKSSNLFPDKNGNFPVIPMIYVDNPVIATSADGKVEYKIGKDFLIEGKVQWSGDRLPFISITLEKPFAIRRTINSRIPDGAKILLSYNYLYRVRGWHNETYSTCISSKYSRDITCNAIRNTIKVLHPDFIHINQDEVVGIGRDGRDKLRMKKYNLTPGQLFADLLNCLRDAARSVGYKKPLLVWDDGLTLKHPGWMLNYNGPYFVEDAINYISPKNFIINVWKYSNFSSNTEEPDYFLKLGFPIIGASSEKLPGIIAWAQYLATRKLEYPEQIRGMFMTIWRTAETTSFCSREDFGRLSWNPGPWVQYKNKKIYIYDLYYKPVSVKINGKAVNLRTEKKASVKSWVAWRAGYIYCADIPKSRSGSLVIEVTNEAGYKSRNIVVVPCEG